MTPAEKLFQICSPCKLAKFLNLNKSWVWRWQKPKSEYGNDGNIPPRHYKNILKISEANNWGITFEDLIGK